jgi:hypothetical protein
MATWSTDKGATTMVEGSTIVASVPCFPMMFFSPIFSSQMQSGLYPTSAKSNKNQNDADNESPKATGQPASQPMILMLYSET